jgi:phosphatidylglycerophosphatase C
MNTEQHSRSVVAVFDLDGTITDCDTYVKFLRLCMRRRPTRIFGSLHLPIAVLLHLIGVFDNAWLKATFLKALAGDCSASTLEKLVNTHVADVMENHIRPAALEAIRHHRQAGHRLLLASASFDFYVHQLGTRLGFDEVVCTRALRGPGDTISGSIDGNNCFGTAKVSAVLNVIHDRQSCTLVAYSDHHSDWGLLLEADIPVAVCPTPELLRLANTKEVDIRYW